MTTNAQLTQQINDLLSAWNQREAQFRAWLAGTPNGGPNGDGKYPLTDAAGVTQLVDSPAKLADTVGGPAGDAAAAQALAEAARDTTVTAKDRAVTAETVITGLHSEVITNRNLALLYRNDAAAYAAQLSIGRDQAVAAKTAAEAARDAALISETNAAASEDNALASANAAAASALQAATFNPADYYTKVASDARYKAIGYVPAWGEITSKPVSFPPSAHTHVIADVTGLQAALDGKQAAGSYAAAVHGHSIADVTGLQTALDGKQAAGSYAAASHTHVIADVTGLQAALDGKQPAGSYLTGITGSMVTTALGYTPYNATNPNGYISGITSGMVTTALGYTPYNSSNPAGYITGITSGMVTTALGYTPANKAGDTFSGAITVNSGAHQAVIAADGAIELTRSGGGAYIDFKDSTAEDFDARIQQSGSGFGITGTVSAGSDFRAPIFYDSNNTGYYVDPASNSVMSTATIGGRSMQTAMFYAGFTLDANTMPSNSTGFTYSVNAPYTGPIMRTSTDGGYDMWLNAPYSGGAALSFRTRNGDTATLNPWYRLAVYDSNPGAGNLYAAICYDTTNTGYYTRPAGSSYIYELTAANTIYSHGWFRSYGDTGWYNQSYGGGIYMIDTSWVRVYNNKGLLADNTIQSGASVRAPIFYDTDNTGYYWNIAGGAGSNIYTYITGLAYFECRYGSGVYSGAVSSPPLQVFSSDGGTAMMSFHRSGAYAVNFGLDPDNYLRIGGWSAGSNRWVLDMSGNNWVAGSSRAPIFYDSDNTGYYIDAASTSNIWRIGANEYRNGACVWRSASTPNWISFYFDAAGADKFHFANDGNLWMGLWGDWVSNQWRSNIFYDAADTGYYCDPNGTSYLNTVSLGAQTWRGDITWNTGVNVLVPASAECSFDINSSGVWQVWDLTTGAPMIKCPAGSNVEIGQAGARGLYVHGSIYATGNVTAYSDASVKDNIKPITGALSKIARIGGYTYTRTDLPDKDRVYGGVVAQEIEEVLPEAVFEKEGRKAVDYNATTALLIEAVKELRAEVEALKNA